MTNNNWEDDFESKFVNVFPEYSEWKRTVKNRPEEVRNFVRDLLTEKDQEHKAKLESIFNEVRNYLKGLDSVPWNEEVDRFIYSLSKISEQKTILDSHINKLSTE